MRAKPKVLLIYPPTQLRETEGRRFDGSLSLPYLAAALRNAGIEADILDAIAGAPGDRIEDTFDRCVMQENGLRRIGMSAEHISQTIARGGYNVVGVTSIFTPQTRMALEVVRAAKAVSPEILVLAGGVNARSLPKWFFDAGVDAICATEGERIIVNMVRAWERGESLAVSGTITMQGERLVHRMPSASDTSTNLDELPVPAWDLLPFARYDAVTASGASGRDSMAQAVRSTAIDTSRGCPFKCTYCHISHEKAHADESGGVGAIRFKSVERVVEEIERLVALDVGLIYFEDDSLLAKKARIREIFGWMKGRGLQAADVNGLNLTHLLKRPGVIDEEYLALLDDAGLKRIVFPVESASQRILNKYATGKLDHDKIDVVELVRIASRRGMVTPINMMVGFPDESEEEMQATFELGRRLVDAGAPYCSLYNAVPFPQTLLFQEAIAGGHLDRDFNPDIFNWHAPVMQNTKVSPQRLEELRREAWARINPPEYVAKLLARQTANRWDGAQPH